MKDLPIMLVVGSNDWLVVPEDFDQLTAVLPDNINVLHVEDYNHVDYMWAIDANKEVNQHIIAFLDTIKADANHLSDEAVP